MPDIGKAFVSSLFVFYACPVPGCGAWLPVTDMQLFQAFFHFLPDFPIFAVDSFGDVIL